jgi:hypothetical protein
MMLSHLRHQNRTAAKMDGLSLKIGDDTEVARNSQQVAAMRQSSRWGSQNQASEHKWNTDNDGH